MIALGIQAIILLYEYPDTFFNNILLYHALIDKIFSCDVDNIVVGTSFRATHFSHIMLHTNMTFFLFQTFLRL